MYFFTQERSANKDKSMWFAGISTIQEMNGLPALLTHRGDPLHWTLAHTPDYIAG